MFKFIIGIILGIIIVIFFIQNAETVTFVFLAWKITVSRALMMLILLLTGVIIGRLSTGFGRFKRKK